MIKMHLSIISQICKQLVQSCQTCANVLHDTSPLGLTIWVNAIKTQTNADKQYHRNSVPRTTPYASRPETVGYLGGVRRDTNNIPGFYFLYDKVTVKWYYIEVYKCIEVVCINVKHVTFRPLELKRRFAQPFLLGLFGFSLSLARLFSGLLCSPQQCDRQKMGTFTAFLDTSCNAALGWFRPARVSTPPKN